MDAFHSDCHEPHQERGEELPTRMIGTRDANCSLVTWVQTFFMTIATVLGTGVLGLPVSLYRCGIAPFVCFFTVTAIAQCGAVMAAVELLQCSQKVLSQACVARDETETLNDFYLRSNEVDEREAVLEAGKGPEPGALHAASRNDRWSIAVDDDEGMMDALTGDLAGVLDAKRPARNGHQKPTSSYEQPSMVSRVGENEFESMASETSQRLRDGVAGNGRSTRLRSGYSGTEGENALNTLSGSDDHDDTSEGPSLHEIGILYLRQRWLRLFFVGSVFLHFVSIMISYGIAGPQAYAQLFRSVRHRVHSASDASTMTPAWTIALFCLLGSILILFFLAAILPVLTIATGIKATLLGVIVAAVSVIGFEVGNVWRNDWGAWIEPFLMGTVALGGVVTVMPVTYARLGPSPSRQGIGRYRAAVLSGLLTCFFLNILWCISVLAVVPQEMRPVTLMSNITFVPSLENADHDGEISTTPLVQTLEMRHMASARAIDALVNVFITVSITVSFLVIGSGLRHMLDGMAASFSPSASSRIRERMESNGTIDSELRMQLPRPNSGSSSLSYSALEQPRAMKHSLDARPAAGSPSRPPQQTSLRLQGINGFTPRTIRYALYLVFYGFILLVAVLNPQGFLTVMEGFTSLGLNLACGVFVALMLLRSNETPRTLTDDQEHGNENSCPRPVSIVLPLSPKQRSIVGYGCLAFFGAAVALDALWWLPRRLFIA